MGPPPGSGGRGTVAGERGVGRESPNSDEGTYTVVLFIYRYFVICLLCYFPTFFTVREGERGELQGPQVVQGDVHHAKQRRIMLNTIPYLTYFLREFFVYIMRNFFKDSFNRVIIGKTKDEESSVKWRIF